MMEGFILLMLIYLTIPHIQSVEEFQNLKDLDILQIFENLNSFNGETKDVWCYDDDTHIAPICNTTCGKHWRLYQDILGNGNSLLPNYNWALKSMFRFKILLSF